MTEIEKFFKDTYVRNTPIIEYLREATRNKLAYFIPLNTPSLKNSKQIQQIFTKNSTCCHSRGGLVIKTSTGGLICSHCQQPCGRHTRPILNASDGVQEYEKNILPFVNVFKGIFKEWKVGKTEPLVMCFYFIRNQYRDFDYGNASEVLLDMFKDQTDKKTKEVIPRLITDDCMRFVKPFFLGCHYSQDKPGTIITLLTKELLEIYSKVYLDYKPNTLF
jgi:hypothetical protein